jgi:hypothetical protein
MIAKAPGFGEDKMPFHILGLAFLIPFSTPGYGIGRTPILAAKSFWSLGFFDLYLFRFSGHLHSFLSSGQFVDPFAERMYALF